jgi:cytochrome oxidase Cu insertion factor (SCO1/SenC/PrrC family)
MKEYFCKRSRQFITIIRIPGHELSEFGIFLVLWLYVILLKALGVTSDGWRASWIDMAGTIHVADLRGRVRLATVSFDPLRDDPAAMAGLRVALAPRGDWRFFTGRDETMLRPVLADFDQDAVPALVREGEAEGALRHVAKVFLIDGESRIRNVYGSGFLDARILMRDLETLLGEGSARPQPAR